MKKNWKRVAAMLLATTMVASLAACGDSSNNTPSSNEPTKKVEATKAPDPTKAPDAPTQAPAPTEGPKEIVTIRWGTHYEQGLNPHFQDEVTGDFVMAEGEREARIAAENEVLDKLGVKFEYVQYAGDTRESLLQSVVAGKPVCDVAVLWGGSEGDVLSQNIIKPLDDFKYIFDENAEMSWMLCNPAYDHYYLMSDVTRFMQRWPLCYNISMVEAVDSLKDANGNTIYPNTLFDEGKWTWSAFKDYLEKVDAYYKNNDGIDAYYTDTRFATLSAAYSNGAAIYGKNGLGANSKEMKEAWNFINDLLKAGLITVELYDDGYTPGWCWPAWHLQDGQTVFAECPDWLIGGAASKRAENNESIGIVPWPRNDSLTFDDERYGQAMTVGDTMCILKGTDDKTTELAIRAMLLYNETYCKEIADVDSYSEYRDVLAASKAAEYGFDIFHEKIGDSILNSFQYIAEKVAGGNDFADIVGVRVTWDDIIGKSYFGIDGYSSYDVSVEQNYNLFTDRINEMTTLLSKSTPNDTVAPNVSKIKDVAAVPAGTKMNDPIWMEFIKATDNGDGELGIDRFQPEFNHVEEKDMETPLYTEDTFKTIGYYNRAFKAYFVDSSNNKGYCTVSVAVYNPDNKVAPTVTLVEAPEAIAVNTEVDSIEWVGKFVATATDVDGLDVSKNLTVDLSTIDTSAAGSYDVNLTFTDYAGNATAVTVKVTVQ